MESVHVERAEGAYLESKEVFNNTLSQLGGEQYWFGCHALQQYSVSTLRAAGFSAAFAATSRHFCLSINVQVSAWIRRTCMSRDQRSLRVWI